MIFLSPPTEGSESTVAIQNNRGEMAIANGQLLYLCSLHQCPPTLRTVLIALYPVFQSFYKISQLPISQTESRAKENAMRIAELYKTEMIKNSLLQDAHLVHLSQWLYMSPHPSAIVGEEILDWLNRFSPLATSQLGLDIISHTPAWSHPQYWDFLRSCILRGFFKTALPLLESLKQEPNIGTHAETLYRILDKYPRSTDFDHEHLFFAALQRTQTQIKDDVLPLLKSSTGAEAQLFILFQMLAGHVTTILEYAPDWLDALAIWGVVVNGHLRRADIPSILSRILEDIPHDPTDPTQSMLVSFFSQHPAKALAQMAQMPNRLYLATHLVDLLDKVGVFKDENQDHRAGMYSHSLRDWFVLEYSDQLASDNSLWSLQLDYLATCVSEEGAGRIRSVITKLPLDLEKGYEKVKSVLKVAHEFGLNAEVKVIAGSTLLSILSNIDVTQNVQDDLQFALELNTLSEQRLQCRLQDFLLANLDSPAVEDILNRPSSDQTLSFTRNWAVVRKTLKQSNSAANAEQSFMQVLTSETTPYEWQVKILQEASLFILQHNFSMTSILELSRIIQDHADSIGADLLRNLRIHLLKQASAQYLTADPVAT